MKIETNQMVTVHGFVMLQKVEGGRRYRIEQGTSGRDSTYTFYLPKGRKAVVRHFADSVDAWVDTPGRRNNFIEIEK